MKRREFLMGAAAFAAAGCAMNVSKDAAVDAVTSATPVEGWKPFPDAKKVKASRAHGEATFITESGVDEARLKKAVDDTGYTFVSVSSEPYKKRGLFG